MVVQKNRTRKNISKSIRIKFKTYVDNIAPISRRVLSRNGPFIDAHFKTINKKNPIGQTYYLRPITTYNSKDRILTIKLNKKQPPVHMNSNSVATNVWYDGIIKIRTNINSEINVNMTLHNGTGRELIVNSLERFPRKCWIYEFWTILPNIGIKRKRKKLFHYRV